AGLLHEPFTARAAREPERVAVLAGDLHWSYGELSRRAVGLARRLRELGAAPNTLVAVVMEKGWEQVVAVLAILGSGAAYLPIDPELPRARRAYLFANGGVGIALTQPHLLERLEWPPEVRRLAVSAARSAESAGLLPAVQGPGDLAYVIYTSGSTGNPKGVMIEHQAAWNTVADVNLRFGVGPGDRVLALSSLAFDLSVYDLFGLLAAGGTVILPAADRSRDPQHWAELLDRHGVTLWNTVPALMELLADFAEVTGYRAPALRLVLLSGDWISLRLPERIRTLAANVDVEVVSLGGATEAAIWSILFPIGEVRPEWRSIPYGRPLWNQRFRILDGALSPRPVWVPGALYIGGTGLARGYWSDPEKTARSFIVEPETGLRLYRTGDLGRYLPDGTIEFLGREDFQVKIGGFRIELGEIEAALGRHPAVREALVVAPAGAELGSRRLVAYCVAAPGTPPTPSDLRVFLGEQLPAYMVPADVVLLEAFPLTANGKLDRQALPDPRPSVAKLHVAPASPVEVLLVDFVREVLKVDAVGVEDDFFALGGNSLFAMQMTSRLRARFGVELPLRTVFENPTIGELARLIQRQRSAVAGVATPEPVAGSERPQLAGAPLLDRVPRQGELPLSFAQERLWFLEQLEPGLVQFNMPSALQLAGPLQPAALAWALGQVERRHEMLRTVFAAVADVPMQGVRPAREPFLLPMVDLGELGEEQV
ncbi:MAG TPA: amino acid adenylation domain-containing protein, partial [Thermoanaerobaculia bacterium]|nr:amino acid adenylation domain-containing protein [Thermoanaerobaculia bacterium]